jgi:hypothetical protein
VSLIAGAVALLPAASSGLPPWAIVLTVAVCVIPASIALGMVEYRARHGKPENRRPKDVTGGGEEAR